MMIYFLLRAVSMVSRFVPLSALYVLAGPVARLASLVPSRARAAVRANIAQATGQQAHSLPVRRAATQAFRCQILNYVDLLRLDQITPAEYDATVVHGDLTPFTDVVAAGKGAIIISAHVGNMDYVGQWLALHDVRVHALMERLKPEKLFQFVCRKREGLGIHMHPVGPEAMGLLTTALREGATVALIADRDITGAGERVEFFGRMTRLPIGPALLALRTGAPLVAAFGRRLPDNRLFVSVRPPVYLKRTRNLRADLQEGLRTIARLLEEGIAETPEQWLVFEPVWPQAGEVA